MITWDDYGVPEVTKWRDELCYFLETICDVKNQEHWIYEIDTQVENYIADHGTGYLYDSGFTGEEYEIFCADELELFGWKTRLTPRTGDQGADILAENNEGTLVIQCKHSASPIGNKAVQEVFAAKEFFEADLAAVVTNSTYTKSAKQLAQKCDIQLLHHDQLDTI